MAIGFGIASRNWWRAQIKGGLFPSFSLNFDTIGTDFTFTRNSFATRVNEFGLIETVTDLGSDLVQNGSFDELSSELVTNGNFDTDTNWTKGANWSIANGKATSNGSSGNLQQSNVLTANEVNTYLVSFDVVEYNSGSVTPNIHGSISGTARSSVGSYSEYITGISSVNTSVFFISSSFDGSIDNVSVKQVDPNDYWEQFGVGITITDKANFDGSGTTVNFRQVGVVTAAKTYKVTYTVGDYSQGNLKMRVGGTYGTARTANGTYTDTLTTANGNFQIYGFSNFIGSIDNIIVKEVLEDDVPRIDYTTGEAAFLLEPISTNLITYSEDFTQYSINTSNLDVPTIVSITNPTGVSSSGLLNINNGVSESKFMYLAISTSSNIHTQSIFFKYVDRQWIQLLSGGTSHYANFDIQNGVVGNTSGCSSTIEDYGNGWYRCTATLDIAATPTNIAITVIDDNTATRLSASTGTGSYYVWGAQVEALPYATSYIPTSGTTVTRAQESCQKANLSTDGLFGGKEGTIFLNTTDMATASTSLNSFTPFRLYRQLIDKYRFYYEPDAAFIGGNIDLSANGGELKMAFSVSDTEITIYVNGSLHATHTIVNPMASDLETWVWATETKYKERVKDFRIYDKALTDDELTDLTAPPPPGPLLDEYPGASAAYSLRELSAAMEGSAVVRVRRSNDNTEQDFTATEITDGTLTTFTGANDGFVTTWYDQSGNSSNAVQTTAIEQPKLVTNGIVELDNGKPCIIWDNTNDRMTISTSYNSSNLLSIFSVYNKTTPNPSDDSAYLVYADASLNVPDGVLAWRYQGQIGAYRSGIEAVNGSIPYDVQVNSNFIYTSTQADFYNNSSLIGSKTSSNAIANFDYTFIQIGRTGGNTSFKNQELIIYQSDQSSNRTGIETNINNEYTIY